MTTRAEAQSQHERRFAEVLELDVDTCANAYGVAACTAGITASGTAQAGGSDTTIKLAAGASAVDDAYTTQLLRITGGMGAGQERVIADYVGATKLATVARWAKNTITYSEVFANWGKAGFGTGLAPVVTESSAPAPDGTPTAARVVFDKGAGTTSTDRSDLAVLGGVTVTGQPTAAKLWLRSATGASYTMRLDFNGTGSNVGGFPSLITVTAQWQAFEIRLSSAVDTARAMRLRLRGSLGTSDYADVYVAFGQQEVGASCGPYLKTTTAPVTAPDATSTYTILNRPAACYNSYGTCQDKANFARTTRTLKFCSRTMAAPAGETIRPYLTDFASTATEIVADKGLAVRGQSTATLVDEPDADIGEDLYRATRASAAGGTFWGRFIARNYNLVGRPARVRRGYIVTPFDWATFETELYIVTDVAGPDKQGKIKLTLQDPIKRLDAMKIPAVTDGKLAADLAAVANTGVAQAGGANTITLAAAASAVDDAYNGMEVYVYAGSGSGQRRTVSSYVGATRVATLSSAWLVAPDTTSSYEVGALQLALNTGKGALYADPATSGKNEYVRIGDEVIRYTAKSGDVLSWPDTTYRAQFGTTRDDGKAGAVVQLCRAWVAQPVGAVVEDLLNEGGIVDAYIDLAGLAVEVATWFSGVTLTACIPTPETAAALLADLLIDLNASVWWDAIAQRVMFKANMPEIGTPGGLDDDDFMLASMDVKRASKDRITQAAIYYELRSATEDVKKAVNYGRAALYVDTNAESANEYGDSVPLVRYSRWLGADNINYATAWASRLISRRRDAPLQFAFRLDPRSMVALGSLVSLETDALQGADGLPATTVARITKVQDRGSCQEVAAVGTKYAAAGGAGRYGFIAPNGQPDYLAASAGERNYAYICVTASGLMSNGDAGYKII